MSPRYSYDRSPKTANSEITKFTGYVEAMDWVQRNFTGLVGQGVYDYVETLHKRIGRQDRWSRIPGFTSWDWGSPRGQTGSYGIRVWLKDSPILPDDIDANIYVTLTFGDHSVRVDATQGRKPLYSKAVDGKHDPSSIALSIGAAWEKLLTGSVDYGD